MILKKNRVGFGYRQKLRVRVGYRVPVGPCLLYVFQCVPPFVQLVQAIWGLQWPKKGMFGQKCAILGPFLHIWVHFSDEFCVQSSPPACVPMCTTICSTCTSHLGPPRPPMAKKRHVWSKMGHFGAVPTHLGALF